ncbi:MAG TPA: hypothetical protein VEQ85_10700 [Lacipirellulaceae bacterium]|nr:hypothetical protein [Lacipirellulaceae bacterium]
MKFLGCRPLRAGCYAIAAVSALRCEAGSQLAVECRTAFLSCLRIDAPTSPSAGALAPVGEPSSQPQQVDHLRAVVLGASCRTLRSATARDHEFASQHHTLAAGFGDVSNPASPGFASRPHYEPARSFVAGSFQPLAAGAGVASPREFSMGALMPTGSSPNGQRGGAYRETGVTSDLLGGPLARPDLQGGGDLRAFSTDIVPDAPESIDAAGPFAQRAPVGPPPPRLSGSR